MTGREQFVLNDCDERAYLGIKMIGNLDPDELNKTTTRITPKPREMQMAGCFVKEIIMLLNSPQFCIGVLLSI